MEYDNLMHISFKNMRLSSYHQLIGQLILVLSRYTIFILKTCVLLYVINYSSMEYDNLMHIFVKNMRHSSYHQLIFYGIR